MNPGGVLASDALITVLAATAEPRDLAPCSITLRPFVPFTPPRA
jgi:hypothetical protein